jgi:voltage-gated potassium channel
MNDTYRTVQEWVEELLEPDSDGRLGKTVDWVVLVLILLNTFAVMLGTVPALKAEYGTLFRSVEMLAVGVFTVEFLARIWVAPVGPVERVSARLDKMSEPYMLVDLLAVAPFWLGSLFGVTVPGVTLLLRLVRVLKIARYNSSMTTFTRIIRRKGDDLLVSVLGTGVLLVLAASLMHIAEGDIQPDAFGSIPAALWRAGVTLTTVGYGDVTPVTAAGRVLAVVLALLGIGLVGLPASILASGFIEDNDPDLLCPHCGEVVFEDDEA